MKAVLAGVRARAADRDDLQALQTKVTDLQRRVLALEAARAPRDEADSALLHIIAAAAGKLPFTAAALWRRAAVDESLAQALEDADVDNTIQLGKWLRRVTGHPFDAVGRSLQRAGTNREGAVLIVRGWQG